MLAVLEEVALVIDVEVVPVGGVADVVVGALVGRVVGCELVDPEVGGAVIVLVFVGGFVVVVDGPEGLVEVGGGVVGFETGAKLMSTQ